tara:strand:+ start:10509 stop:10727 length:219 start_codon:yes stop_codon:yes gene_type:complete
MEKQETLEAATGGTKSKEYEDMLAAGEERFPGVTELLRVYGGYEKMVLEVQEYLDLSRPQQFGTTSNRSQSY